MSGNLKPCPFCGEDTGLAVRYTKSTDTYAIDCAHCQTVFSMDCTAGHNRQKETTIKAWNRRSSRTPEEESEAKE